MQFEACLRYNTRYLEILHLIFRRRRQIVSWFAKYFLEKTIDTAHIFFIYELY